MLQSVGKVFFSLSTLLLLISANGPFQLKKGQVKAGMDEMLGYHVEYKEFSPLIAKRSLKIYFQQFDSEKIYLLASEVRPFLDFKEDKVRTIIQKYAEDNLSEYAAANQKIQEAIARARNYRLEIIRDLIKSDAFAEVSLSDSYLDYAASEAELKARIKNQLLMILAAERRSGTLRAWNAEQRKKLFDLWERRFARLEDSYLPSASLTEHYLCMHTLKAMAKSLDAHSSYFSPEEAYAMRTSLEKQFEGIGVVLREGIDGIVIHDMIKGGPAERCGKISKGDLLVEIDGKAMTGVSYDEVLNHLQGAGKNKLRLGFRHFTQEGNSHLYHVELKREKIVMQDDRVRYSYEPFGDGIIGKLSLPSFYESEGSSCEIDLRKALRELKQKGNLLGLVLDLRENSGGFLNQAVKVAGLFLSSGVIVISKYAHNETQYLRNLDIKSYYNGPLLILTSRASASAAEIVAQALQDYGAALVVGDDRTYGKGTIQYQTVTDNNASSFFKVTVGRYYTVSGRTTQIDGVKADLIVPTLYSSMPIGERYLEFPLKGDRIPSVYSDPLVDIDPRNKPWFQQNYLPNLQKKLSVWTQMIDQLRDNSSHRLQKNKDYKAFIQAIELAKKGEDAAPTSQNNWGVEDLQMSEAMNILKDMTQLKAPAAKKVALLML